MGKRTFITVITVLSLFMIALALLPVGVSIKESLWIARHMWFTQQPEEHSHLGEITLDIDYDDYRTLGATRVNAIEVGALLDTLQIYVPATFNDGIKRKVAVKLKGMRPTHWKHPVNWSFRVVILAGEETFEGMRIFSIQKPFQRGHYVDALYHDFLGKAGVMNLQYDFVKLDLRGMNLGTYMIEEFFDAPILKRLGKPDGPIIRFDYEQFWAGIDWNDPKLTGMRDSLAAAYHTTPIKSYKYTSGTYKGWKQDSKKARKLLNGFRKEELEIGDVFNIPAFAAYFAVNTLFGNQHPALLTNLRFYYDPGTKLLEPVGYDIEGIYSLEHDTQFEFCYWPSGNTKKRTEFVAQVFSDTSFYVAYKRAMTRISDSAFIAPILTNFHLTFDLITESGTQVEDRRGLIWENAGAYRRHFGVEPPE